jgi:hypothetical protein
MKVVFHILGFKADAQLRDQLTSELQELNDLIPIEHADIALARQREAMLPYQAVVMLGVPGPDIHAAARDHTWPAAWQKVINRLREQIQQRRRGQRARQKARRTGQITARPSLRLART